MDANVKPEANGWDRRLAYVTGKGGVGKTTVSASLCIAAARQGLKVLLASTEPDHYRSLLPGARWGPEPTPMDAQLSVVHLHPHTAFEQYGRLILRPRLAQRAVFGNRYSKNFLAAIPGLSDWAVLGKTWHHATETQNGKARFDRVVLDAPATGHALQMLRVPQSIRQVAPPGPLRRDAERAHQMLSDPSQTGIVVVGLAEPMPTNETLELLEALRDDLHMSPSLLVVNRVEPPVLTRDQAELLHRLNIGEAPPPIQRALGATLDREAKVLVQGQCLDRLAHAPCQTLELPNLTGQPLQPGQGVAHHLADYFLPTPR